MQIDDFESLTLDELRKLAAKRGVEQAHNRTRKALLAALKESPLESQKEAERPQSGTLIREGNEEGEDNAKSTEEDTGAQWPRRMGGFLQIAAGFGIGTHLVIMVAVLVFARPFFQSLQQTISGSLESTREVAGMVRQAAHSLDIAGDTLLDVSELLATTEAALGESGPLMQSVGEVIGEEAPATIEATQGALYAAQNSAQAIDSTLYTLSLLRPLTGVNYDPERSLSESLHDVAENLEPLPNALKEVQTELFIVQENLDEIRPGLSVAEEDLETFAESLPILTASLEEQVLQVERIAADAEENWERLRNWRWALVGLIEFGLAWMLIGQISAFLVGKGIRERGYW